MYDALIRMLSHILIRLSDNPPSTIFVMKNDEPHVVWHLYQGSHGLRDAFF
jgi:hypothetical protein